MTVLAATLTEILNHLALPLSASVQQKLLHYLKLLEQWNRVYNLTAITDPRDQLIKHIGDSLTVAPHLVLLPTQQAWLDVGTGAGLPGIPLALCFPQWTWTLLDSNAKKTRFLVQAKSELGLDNISVVHARVESLPSNQQFDGIICRAWTRLADIVSLTQSLCAAHGHLYAMKGLYPTAELADITQSYRILPLHVPFLNEQRHLVCVNMAGEEA